MAGADKPTGGGASRRELPASRAARLRRQAQLLEDAAERATDPAAARELAREMRRRASVLECGPEPSDEEEARRVLMFMAGEKLD